MAEMARASMILHKYTNQIGTDCQRSISHSSISYYDQGNSSGYKTCCICHDESYLKDDSCPQGRNSYGDHYLGSQKSHYGPICSCSWNLPRNVCLRSHGVGTNIGTCCHTFGHNPIHHTGLGENCRSVHLHTHHNQDGTCYNCPYGNNPSQPDDHDPCFYLKNEPCHGVRDSVTLGVTCCRICSWIYSQIPYGHHLSIQQVCPQRIGHDCPVEESCPCLEAYHH